MNPVKMKRQLRSLLFTVILALSTSSLCLARDIAIVVDKTNTASMLSTADLTKILKALTKTWPDGKKITVFLSNPASADMKMIVQKVYGMAPGEVKAFAEQHRGEIILVGSDDLVLKAVQTNPGAVGVVNVYAINSSVKVLKVDGKLPLESGYLFHASN